MGVRRRMGYLGVDPGSTGVMSKDNPSSGLKTSAEVLGDAMLLSFVEYLLAYESNDYCANIGSSISACKWVCAVYSSEGL